MLKDILLYTYILSVIVVLNFEIDDYTNTYKDACISTRKDVIEYHARKNILNDEVTDKMVREIATVKAWLLIIVVSFIPVLNSLIAARYIHSYTK